MARPPRCATLNCLFFVHTNVTLSAIFVCTCTAHAPMCYMKRSLNADHLIN